MRYRAFAVPAMVAVSLVAACTGKTRQPPQPQPPSVRPSLSLASPASANGCAGQPPDSPLPVWARAGFTPPDMAMPHVMGAAGNIVAILWATPRYAPPRPPEVNKILWVSRIPSTRPMTIGATLAGSTRTATVYLPQGPGPSHVNMPAPGCWTLRLSWGAQTDLLSLRWVG